VNGLLFIFDHIILINSIFCSPGYRSLLLFVRNQAQALINQRRTLFPLSSQLPSTKKQAQTDQSKSKFHFRFLNIFLYLFR
jgi:hypothetical protein